MVLLLLLLVVMLVVAVVHMELSFLALTSHSASCEMAVFASCSASVCLSNLRYAAARPVNAAVKEASSSVVGLKRDQIGIKQGSKRDQIGIK